jgi:hypothetical protein
MDALEARGYGCAALLVDTIFSREMRACPTKARLDFIGDKQSAPGLYAGYRLGQKSRRR